MPQGQPTKVKKRKKSVIKRAQQGRQRAEVNRANRTRVRSMIRRLRTAIGAKDATAAGNLLHVTMSAIDRALTKGVLHENTANRYKSRLTLAYNAVKAKGLKATLHQVLGRHRAGRHVIQADDIGVAGTP